jgi:hypothetical protein
MKKDHEVPTAAYEEACWEGLATRGTSGNNLELTRAEAQSATDDLIVSAALEARHKLGVAGNKRFPRHWNQISGDRSVIHVPYLLAHTREVDLYMAFYEMFDSALPNMHKAAEILLRNAANINKDTTRGWGGMAGLREECFILQSSQVIYTPKGSATSLSYEHFNRFLQQCPHVDCKRRWLACTAGPYSGARGWRPTMFAASNTLRDVNNIAHRFGFSSYADLVEHLDNEQTQWIEMNPLLLATMSQVRPPSHPPTLSCFPATCSVQSFAPHAPLCFLLGITPMSHLTSNS